MKREEIKTLEDAMTYIDEVEKKHSDYTTEIEALKNQNKTLTESNDRLSKENTSVKEKYYDLWLKEGRQTKEVDESQEEIPQEKSLEELLMED